MQTPRLRTPLKQRTVTKAREAVSLSSQNRVILDFLKSGRALTQMLAITHLGIGSLTKRISELRELGYIIEGELKEDFHGHVYMSYSIAGEG